MEVQRSKLLFVQSRGGGGMGPLTLLFIKWPLGKARVGHLSHNVNGEILSHVKSNENDPLKISFIEH